MMKLYNFHASSTSYRTRIVLNLKGLPYEYIPIRLDKGEHLTPAYTQINPMRGVPTLEMDGVRLYQSTAIIEYLEEVYPTPPLLPKDSYAAAKVLRRMYFTRSASVCQSIGSIKNSVAPRTNPRSSEAASSTPVAIRIGIDLVAP